MDQIVRDLTAAMKAREELRTSVLRMAKAALMNKQIDKKEGLEDADAIKVLRTLVKQREDSAQQFRKAGRVELAEKEEAEKLILQAYLPQEASDDEIRAAVAHAIAETGAASPKDMGKVMKAAMAVLQEAGKPVDGKRVNQQAREQLAR